MKRIALIFVILFIFNYSIFSQQSVSQLTRTTNTITPNGLDQQHRITYYIIDTGVAGPNFVILGGVHGNEPASWRTAMHIVDNFAFPCGRFLIIPRANPSAVAAGTRETPGYPAGNESNLNRQFPGNENGTTTQRIAAALTKLIEDFKPDVIIDLHEAIMGNTWSTTGPMPHVIFYGNPRSNNNGFLAANSAAEAINKTALVKDSRNFRTHRSGWAGLSSTEFPRKFNIPVFLIETGRPLADGVANPLNLRIEQHLFLVNELVQFFTNTYHSSP